jgi:hypothetical protein
MAKWPFWRTGKREGGLDAHYERQPFDKFFVAISDGDLGDLRNFGDFSLSFSFTG